ncbi:aspartate carbamoyltransferase [Nitrosococcus oceani ATCC 19707]|uniref:Aspartate carbamoyltransferase n=2 Tax=Nitrosococcus oceani TaxID=1229 RepID=Q3JD05_NITOC|nr:aspartate carbamoyltransferase [Nitrosococcus oceani]ABA57291.1 aspartate carbamoyltransferase [Nitrosococcus oceani ATCC 19707]EDZ66730.1 Aspartate/ornithine carbamoyltransferase, Asp/Orn binding domain family [Nitrosococcus oceani AFC27]KFI20267.1 aspartate carbamoyltransferase [Nitrosococcus oceani C-27]GEM20165.1 aspartate carbamoyltransferase [Nitrosococcus oceani]
MVKKFDPLLRKPLQPKDDTAGIERPLALMEQVLEDPAPLVGLANRPVLSARQFDRDKIIQLSRLAALYETTPTWLQLPLAGKILINAFYEPSTRTRLSFESAWHRLGGDVMPITDPATTGIAKGETLADVAEMFNNYGDLVVLRDSSEEAVYQMLESLRIPIINAGNGIDEHPTQALADLYTLFKWRPQLMASKVSASAQIRIGVVGAPRYMRTVRSLLLFLALFAPAIKEVVVICQQEEVFAKEQREELALSGLTLRTARQLNPELPALDVVYINSIAWRGDSFEKIGEDLRLCRSSPFKPGAIILHPLARGKELATDLDNTEHNWYFAQARGAVFMRMALLTTLVQRIDQVMDTPMQS